MAARAAAPYTSGGVRWDREALGAGMSRTSFSEDALYERDFYSWTRHQADLLRHGRLDGLDVENIAEELETLGRSERAALKSAYRLVALHLLKLIAQPAKATPSWEDTIHRERGNILDILEENPGLKPKRAEAFAKAYARARQDAAFETGLPIERFPKKPPFTLGDAEASTFWPEGFPRARPSNETS